MSAPAVRAFLPTLRSVERQLSVPIPARVRILRELEFDLEELRRRLEAKGHPAEDARARSLDALVPDPRALRELARALKHSRNLPPQGRTMTWVRKPPGSFKESDALRIPSTRAFVRRE